MKKFLIVVTGVVVGGLVLLFGVLALLGAGANEVAKEFEKDTTTSKVDAKDLKSASGGDGRRYSWSGLQVAKDDFGMFEGSIQVTNETDSPAEVFVSVTAYDGEQTLGSLDGSARVKPGASTEIGLTSLDDFAKASDFEVEVSGF